MGVFTLIVWNSGGALDVKLISIEWHIISLIRHQHLFREWLGVTRQKNHYTWRLLNDSNVYIVLYIFQEHFTFRSVGWHMMTSSNGNIHRSAVDAPHKGRWRGALMFSLICAWTNSLANKQDAGDFRHHRVHYEVWNLIGILIIICNGCWYFYMNSAMAFWSRIRNTLKSTFLSPNDHANKVHTFSLVCDFSS